MKREQANKAGFTLIEVLVVISIIGVLAGLVGVLISKARSSADENNTVQLVTNLGMKIEMYRQEMGRYPASTLSGLQKAGGKVKLWKDVTTQDGNEINQSIEVLVVQLRHPDFSKRLQDDDLGAINPATDNIDEDEFTTQPAGSEDGAAIELLDAWGNPVIYIYNADYDKVFQVMNARGELKEVSALKKPSGTFYNPNKFQIICLGVNGEQETEGDPELWDDIHNFTPVAGE